MQPGNKTPPPHVHLASTQPALSAGPIHRIHSSFLCLLRRLVCIAIRLRPPNPAKTVSGQRPRNSLYIPPSPGPIGCYPRLEIPQAMVLPAVRSAHAGHHYSLFRRADPAMAHGQPMADWSLKAWSGVHLHAVILFVRPPRYPLDWDSVQ